MEWCCQLLRMSHGVLAADCNLGQIRQSRVSKLARLLMSCVQEPCHSLYIQPSSTAQLVGCMPRKQSMKSSRPGAGCWRPAGCASGRSVAQTLPQRRSSQILALVPGFHTRRTAQRRAVCARLAPACMRVFETQSAPPVQLDESSSCMEASSNVVITATGIGTKVPSRQPAQLQAACASFAPAHRAWAAEDGQHQLLILCCCAGSKMSSRSCPCG